MKLNKLQLLSVFVAFVLSGCAVQYQGSFGGLVSMKNEIIKNEPQILSNENLICEGSIESKNKINIINATQLRNCIAEYENVLIYLWKPNCSSDQCLDIELVQNVCKENDIELFIVAQYYDLNKMNQSYNLDRQILGIDTKYYKSNFTKKYVARFFKELIHDSFDYNNSQFYFFTLDKYQQESNDLYALISTVEH